MAKKNTPEIVELDFDRFNDLLRRAKDESFDANDYETIHTVVQSYGHLLKILKDKDSSLERLRNMLFGSSTEKTSAVIGDQDSELPPGDDPPGSGTSNDKGTSSEKKKRKGHGRNGADAYAAAEHVEVPHESLKPGESCPECEQGTVYGMSSPGVLVRIVGQAPLQATVYELEKLRCNLCGKVFTAKAPPGVGRTKYDITAASMIGLLKYGSGFPFNRLERLQQNLSIPLPAATQWDVLFTASKKINPAYEELIRQAAQGDLVQNDDTSVRILELMGKRARALVFQGGSGTESPTNKDGSARTGIYTSGVVSTCAGRKIVLFYSGQKHAGENLMDVLAHRSESLDPPIQMCDALARNLPGELETVVANCLAHARRHFVEVYEHFPEECRYVLESLGAVYKNDAEARDRELSPEQRLAWHQAESTQVMNDLKAWLRKQIDDRLVERNSGLGKAIAYMRNHWKKLTLFLRKAGAPLDNNLCERVIKKAILHRKNALFFKTRNGARIGDLYMSLIHTCELCSTNPFDYLTELQRHSEAVAANPSAWMPWNYRQALGTESAAA